MDTTKLLEWYRQNKRDLPWRDIKDPYKIWLSEIILQQTQVAQGLPYYLKFIDSYPSIYQLAAATEQEVLNLWQGLGYYTRARNLHHTAKDIVANYNGVFPETYKELLKLKGIGEYTAAAIASFCYDEPVAVLDGNVYRVLARFFGIDTPTNTTAGKKLFKKTARQNLDIKNPGLYNQAVMEFGALHCTPAKPRCDTCPFVKECVAFQTGQTANLPVKLPKIKIKKRYLHYFFVEWQDQIVLEKRKGKGIWQNLYQLPMIEKTDNKSFSSENLSAFFKKYSVETDNSPVFVEKTVHKLTHQHLHITFWKVQSQQKPLNTVLKSALKDYPLPVVIANFLNRHYNIKTR